MRSNWDGDSPPPPVLQHKGDGSSGLSGAYGDGHGGQAGQYGGDLQVERVDHTDLGDGP